MLGVGLLELLPSHAYGYSYCVYFLGWISFDLIAVATLNSIKKKKKGYHLKKIFFEWAELTSDQIAMLTGAKMFKNIVTSRSNAVDNSCFGSLLLKEVKIIL